MVFLTAFSENKTLFLMSSTTGNSKLRKHRFFHFILNVDSFFFSCLFLTMYELQSF